MTARVKRAILVGVSEYEARTGLSQLPTVEATVKDFGRALTYCGYESRNISMLLNPTLKDVVDTVELVTAKPSEILLFYYAGHGAPSRSDALHLALPDSADSERSLLGWMPYGAIHQALESAKRAGNTPAIVSVLDCCYAALADEIRATSPLRVSQEDCVDGGLVLAACAPNARAVAPKGKSYTLLGGSLIELMLGGDVSLPSPIRWGDAATRLMQSLEPKPAAIWAGDGPSLPFAPNRGSKPISHRSLPHRPAPAGPTALAATAVGLGVLGSLWVLVEDWIEENS